MDRFSRRAKAPKFFGYWPCLNPELN